MPFAFAVAALLVVALLFARRASAASADDEIGEVEVTAKKIPSLPPLAANVRGSQSSSIRGVRNKNPGNLRFFESIKWLGQTGSDNEGYAIFDTDAHGLRAAVINLRTSINRRATNTIRKIITRWAPSHENPTNAYIDFVSRQTRISPDTIVTFVTNGPAIMRAIVRFELGIEPFDDAFYTQTFKAAA